MFPYNHFQNIQRNEIEVKILTYYFKSMLLGMLVVYDTVRLNYLLLRKLANIGE